MVLYVYVPFAARYGYWCQDGIDTDIKALFPMSSTVQYFDRFHYNVDPLSWTELYHFGAQFAVAP